MRIQALAGEVSRLSLVEGEERTDERRSAILASFEAELGDAVVGSQIRPDDDVWIRVRSETWRQAAQVARDHLGCRYFCFLSAIDWLPSPYGRYEDAEVDEPPASSTAATSPTSITSGYAGGDSRFQLCARVAHVQEHYGITLKADVPEDMRIDSWTPVYAGADWHEREVWEMFGISFVDHPHLVHLYLPGAFEGHPLRKDFPLLARVVKPWPGIVDVEPMPGDDDEEDEDGVGVTTGSEDGGDDE